jgi:hypothetical protein
VFTREDLARLKNTFLKRVLMADDRISDTVGGGGRFNNHRPAVLRWARLGRHFPELRARLIALSSSQPGLGRETTALSLGIAYLSLPPAWPGKPAGR